MSRIAGVWGQNFGDCEQTVRVCRQTIWGFVCDPSSGGSEKMT
jgi:hypothetical protein